MVYIPKTFQRESQATWRQFIKGIILGCTSTVCPESGPSWTATVTEVPWKWVSTALLTRWTQRDRSASSAAVRSARRLAGRKTETRTSGSQSSPLQHSETTSFKNPRQIQNSNFFIWKADNVLYFQLLQFGSIFSPGKQKLPYCLGKYYNTLKFLFLAPQSDNIDLIWACLALAWGLLMHVMWDS